MNDDIVNLKPAVVWRQFAAISAIPRCSKNEAAVREYVVEQARRYGREVRTDAVGNVVVAVSGTADRSPVIIQGHLDMVCEKNRETNHDFETDPIALVRDGDWLRADNTTLGADNGIAVAMMLALLEDPPEAIPPLELLFTVDEETGLTGALQLDASIIHGRTLINLDTEEEGFFCIGCAGGKNTYGTLPLVWTRPGDADAEQEVEISLTGLSGGHSGADIHREFGNSVVLGARLLGDIRAEAPSLRIVDIAGGDKHNAIPREFYAVVTVAPDEFTALADACAAAEARFREELGDREPGLTVTPQRIDRSTLRRERGRLEADETGRVIDLLRALPHGVLGMSHDVPGLVETSTNLAAVRIEAGDLTILTSQRSSRGSLIDAASERVAATIRLAGGTPRFAEGYPSWPPRPSSPLVDTAVQVYTQRFGEKPEVGAFHAGLECGVIGAKVGDIDMISFGPTMQGVHTPDERIEISSTQRTWDLLVGLLGALGEKP